MQNDDGCAPRSSVPVVRSHVGNCESGKHSSCCLVHGENILPCFFSVLPLPLVFFFVADEEKEEEDWIK